MVGGAAVARAVLAWSHSVHAAVQGVVKLDGRRRIGRQNVAWRCAIASEFR